jgi:DNA transposition AAA+ family ATPase
MTIEINDVRESVAEFASKAGISQVEAACEMCLVLGNVLAAIEGGLPHAKAVDAGIEAFTSRWGDVF